MWANYQTRAIQLELLDPTRFHIKINFRVSIHVNSETLGLLYTSKYPISVSPCEPELYSHFRPHTHHNPICFTNFMINNPNSPWSVTNCTNGFQNFLTIRFQDLGPIKRSFKASNRPKHHKTLKQSVKPSRIKPLPHGVCRNSLKLEPTRRPLRVERHFFLLRRIPTVGFVENLERSLILSH